ncbi:MAG: HEPN domain-containing protein [Erysipelotrichaceae bacterium]|nr:HEPN domain-containing protein [Erysipelotrichaceae bacterium]
MEKHRIDLSLYRLEKAKQCLSSSRILYDTNDYLGSANRSYYAIFHSMRAVLALEKKDFSKHSAVISYFRKEYIKTGMFDKTLSRIISEAFDVRTDSDYNDFYILSKEEIYQQIENAEEFYNEIENYIHLQLDDKD